MTHAEIIERGIALAAKYSEEELKAALKNAIAMKDNLERLALQYALKQKTNTTDGYAFTEEQKESMKSKLHI